MQKQIIGWDTETACFGAARMAPKLVVSSVATGPESVKLYHILEGRAPLLGLFGLAAEGKIVIVGHNVAYDVAVAMAAFPSLDFIELVFRAYAADGITDTLIRQKLIDIAQGRYRGWRDATTGKWHKVSYYLAELADRHLGRELDKSTTWRTRYEELIETPVADWPAEAVAYAEEDGLATRDVYLSQESDAQFLVDQYRQTRAALALQLASVWGIRTDAVGVELLRKGAQDDIDALTPELVREGLLRKNGSRALKVAQERMAAVNPTGKQTPTGKPAVDEEACFASKDPVLINFSRFTKAQNVLAKDVKAMLPGTVAPIHTRFDSLMETGRTSSSGPNLQNPRRQIGVRECFVPRPGFVYAACDYDKAELHTLSQVCLKILGYSRLGERLNQGFDPHLDMGAQMLGITYEDALARKTDEEIKKARQSAKVANFGFPGGMGINGFLEYARSGYGVEMTETEAKNLRENYLATWPEMNDYFAWVKALCGDAGVCTIKHLFSGRVRGLITYTVACNSFFQGLAADGAKAALFEVARRQYSDPTSYLFGSRTVNFIHDELLVEVPEHIAHEAATELQTAMIEAFNPWVPDVPVRAGVSLMRRWSKNAEPVWVDGRLVPWEDAA
jgi:DNA polymerase-1